MHCIFAGGFRSHNVDLSATSTRDQRSTSPRPKSGGEIWNETSWLFWNVSLLFFFLLCPSPCKPTQVGSGVEQLSWVSPGISSLGQNNLVWKQVISHTFCTVTSGDCTEHRQAVGLKMRLVIERIFIDMLGRGLGRLDFVWPQECENTVKYEVYAF